MNKPTRKLTPEEEFELENQTRDLKKALKRLSKNELIQLVTHQINLLAEQQTINRILFEKTQKQEETETK